MIGRSLTIAVAFVLVASNAWAGSMCPRQTQAMAVMASTTPPAQSTTIVTEPTGDEDVVATEQTSTETSN